MLYAIQNGEGGPVKIGFSESPWKRFAKIKTDNPTDCRMIGVWAGTEADEQALHAKLAAHRVRGEWFEPSAEVLHAIPERLEVQGRRKAHLYGARYDHSLSRWMTKNEITDSELAAIAGCDRTVITKARQGKGFLGVKLALGLVEATGGALTLNDIYGVAAASKDAA